jgi:hypothetical protein
MKYTYRLVKDTDGVTATCSEMPVSATGANETAAIAALRAAIYDHLTHVEAIAPPASVPVPSIQLAPAEDPTPEPQGPGDAPAAERT